MNILIIENEYKVAEALKEGLEHEGYSVDLAHTGEDGFFLLNSKQYDLLLLVRFLLGRKINRLEHVKIIKLKKIIQFLRGIRNEKTIIY